jgi:hypothetical protein
MSVKWEYCKLHGAAPLGILGYTAWGVRLPRNAIIRSLVISQTKCSKGRQYEGKNSTDTAASP